MIFILAHFLLKLGSVHTLCKSGNLKEVVFMNNSAALSQFAVNLKYEDIPAEVIEMAKKMAIQTIGAALASKEMDFTQSVLDFSKKYSQRSGRCHFDARRQKNLSIGCCICKQYHLR